MPWRQLAHPADDRVRVGDVTAAEVARQTEHVELAADARMREDGSQLGPEDQPAAELRVVERLLAHAIPRQEEDLAPFVPQPEREHAVEMPDAVLAEILPRMDDHFGVGPGLEAMPALDQRLTQLDMVVDLAVENRPDRAVLVGERLVAGLQIDDAEPPVPQSHRPAHVIAVVVGAAMAQRGRHPTHDVDVGALVARTQEAGNAAHTQRPATLTRHPRR